MSDGKYHFAKPWLGCVLHMPDDDTRPQVVYWTEEPIVACSAADAKKAVFAEAIRTNKDILPEEVEAFVVPFSPYVD